MKQKEKRRPLSVVYSFSGRWEEPLRLGNVKVFFRKRRPVIYPDRVFLYVGVPAKRIIGYAGVQRILQVGLTEAIEMRSLGAITENELVKYIGVQGSVHAIHIEKPILFEKPFSLEELDRDFGFSPPQSFSKIDDEFEENLTRRATK